MRAVATALALALVATLATAAQPDEAAATAAQPDDGAIVLLGGAARTFLCCFGSTVVNLLRPLDADLYAYLKLKDAATSLVGERAAGGDRELYRPANASRIWGALAKYEKFVGAKLVDRLPCDDACLLQAVGCRGRFAGHLANDSHLERALGQHALLSILGDELRRLEARRGRRYAVVAWARPDVVVRQPDPTSMVGDAPRSCGGGSDLARVLPRDAADKLLFSGMAAAREPCGPFGTPECDSRDARKLRVECRPYAREQEDFVRRAVQTTGCADVWPRRAKMCMADPEATTYRGAPVFEGEAALHAGAP
ncbi:hypothetical protein JL722_12140 [Aureococcus anophagefferens]|nr:hypothetical protein JL722_12140 [Aureococcus anophagefferens]